MKRLAVVLVLLCLFLYATEKHTIEVYGKKIPLLFYFPEHSFSAIFSQTHPSVLELPVKK